MSLEIPVEGDFHFVFQSHCKYGLSTKIVIMMSARINIGRDILRYKFMIMIVRLIQRGVMDISLFMFMFIPKV